MDNDLLQPDPDTVTVAYHPSREHGDVVSVRFHDGPTGVPFRVVLDPATAEYLSVLLHTAVVSPRVTGIADQMKAAQRDK